MLNDESLKNIEKLHEMKASGIISEEEFAEAKQKLLSGGRPHSKNLSVKSEALSHSTENKYLEWMLMPLRRYAEFEGRSSRKEFWMFLLALNIISLIILSLGIFIGIAAVGLWAFAVLGILVPYLAVQVRRFHDQGKSGWFVLLNLIPYVGALIILGFMLVEGEQEENIYGPNPYS